MENFELNEINTDSKELFQCRMDEVLSSTKNDFPIAFGLADGERILMVAPKHWHKTDIEFYEDAVKNAKFLDIKSKLLAMTIDMIKSMNILAKHFGGTGELIKYCHIGVLCHDHYGEMLAYQIDDLIRRCKRQLYLERITVNPSLVDTEVFSGKFDNLGRLIKSKLMLRNTDDGSYVSSMSSDNDYRDIESGEAAPVRILEVLGIEDIDIPSIFTKDITKSLEDFNSAVNEVNKLG